MLNVGELWLTDWRVKKVAPMAGGPCCIAALVATKQLALQHDGVQHATVLLLSLPQGGVGVSLQA